MTDSQETAGSSTGGADPVPCFSCGAKLEQASETTDPGYLDQAIDAVMFRGYGNWGSGVFDPLHSRRHLLINICDHCLTDPGKARRVVVITKEVPPAKYTRRAWNGTDQE